MSHIIIDSERVINACESWIAAYNIRVEKRLIEIITKASNTWTSKLFFFKDKDSYEKAKELLEAGECPNYQIEYDITKMCKSDNYERAEKLLILARLGDPVYLSVEDTFIFK